MNGYEDAAVGAASVLARLAARLILRQHLGKASFDEWWFGCEIWRNPYETIWFVKCRSCPAVAGLVSSRAAAENFAARHHAEVHDIGQGH